MIWTITPHLQLRSVLELTSMRLQSMELEGLLLDVDCTLKDHRATAFRTEIIDWVGTLRTGGVRMCLLSNGRPGRIGALADTLQIPFVAKAFKPLPFGCYHGLKKLQVEPKRVGLVGDQVFADVLAGRLAGLTTILVQPTTTEEPWFTRVKRPMERRFLRWIGGTAQVTVQGETQSAIVAPTATVVAATRINAENGSQWPAKL